MTLNSSLNANSNQIGRYVFSGKEFGYFCKNRPKTKTVWRFLNDTEKWVEASMQIEGDLQNTHGTDRHILHIYRQQKCIHYSIIVDICTFQSQ